MLCYKTCGMVLLYELMLLLAEASGALSGARAACCHTLIIDISPFTRSLPTGTRRCCQIVY